MRCDWPPSPAAANCGRWTSPAVRRAGCPPRVRSPTRAPTTGRRVAYRDGDTLRVVATDGTGDRALATPDRPDTAFGTAPHTSATCDGPRGLWWSPDDTRLLAARTDSARVAHWYLADPARPEDPPRAYRYAAAGRANSDVTLWLTELDGTRTEARWDRAGFEYVIGAGWDEHGPYALVQSRDQRTVLLLGIDPADGRTTVLAQQRDACWVHPVPGLPVRTAGGALVGHTDLGATRHLTVDGSPVTPPGLQLRAVLGVEGEQVLFTACGEPTETHLWRYDPNGGPVRLTEGPGLHTGAAAGGTLVLAARRRDRPGPRVTVARDGRPALSIASLTQPPVLRTRDPARARGRPTSPIATPPRPSSGRPPDCAARCC
ncbi:DPP IV N-terminal domain-containing protein [Streptantibioticus silvisoli]|uniref:DPP IV N-terminal domain-containing protein n=1 Tax=Streptantibioticus silvisoli TaxID=2705255 RepID=A0ABT6W2M6_9ACTN|nr:DPP IV N-terminal domain-containing protein [Streptantibioticus silvisoli]MDI5964993.1 DPP IV N-terminal domain-containing protein [Streptantibioticus silvisoli]